MNKEQVKYYANLVEEMAKKEPAYPSWGYFTCTEDGRVIKLNPVELESFYDRRSSS